VARIGTRRLIEGNDVNEPKVLKLHLSEAPTHGMRYDRGTQIELFDPSRGAGNIDFHINVINVDSGPGPYHYHEKSENVYLVLEGTIWAVIDGQKYVLEKDDVAFIPPGVRHCAGNGGDVPARVVEIYAPPGPDFHIVEDEEALAVWANR